ncbi:Protein of unknown function [Lactobacillus delbrueckii subsp. lactis]|nr:Putative uncharacterized protein [Lactobacillus delbrueckii subsp. lactis]CDR79697.1 Protein of unknown function [Lactobacillus delbrueckii subsp. lactis]CDR84430.1 Protein of unknown function [Lactobacillus delbrueckii subsp. lactis]
MIDKSFPVTDYLSRLACVNYDD